MGYTVEVITPRFGNYLASSNISHASMSAFIAAWDYYAPFAPSAQPEPYWTSPRPGMGPMLDYLRPGFNGVEVPLISVCDAARDLREFKNFLWQIKSDHLWIAEVLWDATAHAIGHGGTIAFH